MIFLSKMPMFENSFRFNEPTHAVVDFWRGSQNAFSKLLEQSQGRESRGLNDRVHGISCLYSAKTCKKVNFISTYTYSIIMQ